MRIRKYSAATVLLLAATLIAPMLLTACGKSVDETVDDATITTRVKTSLLNDPDVATLRIDVDTFKGVVTEVGGSPILPAAGQSSNAIKFLVRVEIKDPPADIKPGLSVSADILTGFREKALVVPIQALVIRDREVKPADAAAGTPRDEEGVFLMEDGKAKFQPIKTGLLGELSLEVTDGLKGGETLITGPFKSLRTLKPGDAVKKEEKKKDGDGPKPS